VPDIEDPLTADPLLGPGLGLRPEDADEADAAAEVEAAEARAYGEIDDERYVEVDALLQQRWPEARIDPSLERIRALCEVLGDPQRAVPAIHLTGTNGKTSTARMTETLLRGLGLRTGTFTSPHLQETRERIAIDGRPLSRARFVEVYDDIAPYLEIVDGRTGHRLSFFEAVTGMAFAAFADAPVDVSVLEVGLGGSWDATNVADGAVAVLTRIDVDHAHLLGDTPAAIATEKVGIIKAGAVVVSAVQLPEVEAVIDARVAEVGATLLRAGRDFEVTDRVVAVGGQLVGIRGIGGAYPDLFLPLHGAHQADNAACALVAAEAFFGGGSRPLRIEAVRESFAAMSSPGRLELVAHQPTVLLDAAHNPDGARATAAAVTEAYRFSRLVGVLGVMADKDVAGVLAPFADVFDEVVVTENSTARALPAEDLSELAERIWPGSVHTVPELSDALAAARRLAADGAPARELPPGAPATPGVLVTGSVVTVGQARALLLGEGSVPGDADGDEIDDDDAPEIALDGDQDDDERIRRSDEAYDGLDL
jgi:dihydrofolate synthase/folylpolyglutamate synthase